MSAARRLRGAALLAALSLPGLAGCDRTPSFDERFNAQADDLLSSANAIEAELSNQLSAAREADRAAAEAASARAADGAGKGAAPGTGAR